MAGSIGHSETEPLLATALKAAPRASSVASKGLRFAPVLQQLMTATDMTVESRLDRPDTAHESETLGEDTQDSAPSSVHMDDRADTADEDNAEERNVETDKPESDEVVADASPIVLRAFAPSPSTSLVPNTPTQSAVPQLTETPGAEKLTEAAPVQATTDDQGISEPAFTAPDNGAPENTLAPEAEGSAPASSDAVDLVVEGEALQTSVQAADEQVLDVGGANDGPVAYVAPETEATVEVAEGGDAPLPQKSLQPELLQRTQPTRNVPVVEISRAEASQAPSPGAEELLAGQSSDPASDVTTVATTDPGFAVSESVDGQAMDVAPDAAADAPLVLDAEGAMSESSHALASRTLRAERFAERAADIAAEMAPSTVEVALDMGTSAETLASLSVAGLGVQAGGTSGAASARGVSMTGASSSVSASANVTEAMATTESGGTRSDTGGGQGSTGGQQTDTSAAQRGRATSATRLSRTMQTWQSENIRQIARLIGMRGAMRNGGNVTLLLKPEHLGTLKLELSWGEDGALRVEAQTESAAAKHLLSSAVDELRAALKQSDITLSAFNVKEGSVSTQSDNGSNASAFQSQGDGSARRETRGSRPELAGAAPVADEDERGSEELGPLVMGAVDVKA